MTLPKLEVVQAISGSREKFGKERGEGLTIIIPAYNEEERIAATLTSYLRYFSNLDTSFEVVVVMDGCTDDTVGIVNDYSQSSKQVKALVFPRKLGKGGAICKGIKAAKGEVVAFVDADGATTPKEVGRLLEKLDDADGTIGSRYMNGAERRGLPITRRIASRGFNGLTRAMFGMSFSDTQCGAKVFRHAALLDVLGSLTCMGFVFDVDLLYHLTSHGYVIEEVPMLWTHDAGSKVRLWKEIPRMGRALLKLRMQKRKARRHQRHPQRVANHKIQ